MLRHQTWCLARPQRLSIINCKIPPPDFILMGRDKTAPARLPGKSTGFLWRLDEDAFFDAYDLVSMGGLKDGGGVAVLRTIACQLVGDRPQCTNKRLTLCWAFNVWEWKEGIKKEKSAMFLHYVSLRLNNLSAKLHTSFVCFIKRLCYMVMWYRLDHILIYNI